MKPTAPGPLLTESYTKSFMTTVPGPVELNIGCQYSGQEVKLPDPIQSNRFFLGLDCLRLKGDGDTNYPADFGAPFRNCYYEASKLINGCVQIKVLIFRRKLILTLGVHFMSY